MQMPQLDISSFSTQIFWTLVSFLILYIFIRYIFDPKIIKAKQERSSIIRNNIELSEKLREQAKYIEDDINNKIEKTKKDLDELMSQNEKRLAEKMADELIKIEQDLAKKYHFAENNIKNKMLAGFDGQVNDISLYVANEVMAKLVGKEYDKEDLKDSAFKSVQDRLKSLASEDNV